MKRLLLFLALAAPAFAANAIYVVPPSPRIPQGGVQSITAFVTGNANQAVTWSKSGSACGSFIGSGNTIGLTAPTLGTCTVTATMQADGATAASSTVTTEAVRPDLQAASTHPRIGLTPADISNLAAKIQDPGNVVYRQGLAVYFAQIQTYYNANFCWTGAGCGTPGPKPPLPAQPAKAWTTDRQGNTAFLVAGTTGYLRNGGLTPSGFTGPNASCFNSISWNIDYVSPTTLQIRTNCPAGNGGAGTITPSLNQNGWIDNSNSFTGFGGGSFDPDAFLYALMSEIDPNAGNRATWAAHSHDMIMWEMNEVCYGAYTGSGPCRARNTANGAWPFYGWQYIMNNRAQYAMLPTMQAIDNNYASYTPADKTILRQIGHIWGQQLTGATGHVAGAPEMIVPWGTYNNRSILTTNRVGGVDFGSNNYSIGHFEAMALLGLLLDPEDDPAGPSCAPSTSTICGHDGTAQKVSAYGVYAINGWLYRLYALFEDAHIVNNQLGLPDPFLCKDMYSGTTPCTGTMSGGFPAEGTGYGSISMYDMFHGIYALYTAGKLNPSTAPQASFISSAFWDKLAMTWIYQLYPQAYVNNQGAPNIEFGDGDDGYQIRTQPTYNILEVYDSEFGSNFRKAIDKWYSYNAQYQSFNSYFYRFMGPPGISGANYGGPQWAINTLLATSPTNDGDFASTSPYNPPQNTYDPRNASTLPLDFVNLSSQGGFYRYYGRNNWTTSATVFQYMCNTATLTHQTSSCGRIDYLRNDETFIVGLNGSSNSDAAAHAPSNQNLPGYQWNPSFNCADGSIDSEICTQGGQSDYGWGDYSNKLLGQSYNSSYYYAATDASGDYLLSFYSPLSATQNVTLSQREVLWLKPDRIFIYDRTAQEKAGFQNFNLDLETNATISGAQATMHSTRGQELFVTSLLPGGTNMTASPLKTSHEAAAPVTCLLTDKVPTPAASTRMLHVVEGKDSGPPSATSLVKSSAGTRFDCATIGATLACFIRTRGQFSSTTFAAASATTIYVTGLSPDTTYLLVRDGVPSSAATDSAGLLTFAATGSGAITVSPAP